MSVDGAILTFQADIPNTIASSFPAVCSSENYDPCFKVITDSIEIVPLSFTPRVAVAYDMPSAWTNFF
jgi:hypothetical protein